MDQMQVDPASLGPLKPEWFRLGRTDGWWSRQGHTKSEIVV